MRIGTMGARASVCITVLAALLGPVRVDVDLDPLVVGVGLGYRF